MTSGSRPPPLPLPLPFLSSPASPRCAFSKARDEGEVVEKADDSDDEDGLSKWMRGDECRIEPVPSASPRQLPSRIRLWPRPRPWLGRGSCRVKRRVACREMRADIFFNFYFSLCFAFVSFRSLLFTSPSSSSPSLLLGLTRSLALSFSLLLV